MTPGIDPSLSVDSPPPSYDSIQLLPSAPPQPVANPFLSERREGAGEGIGETVHVRISNTNKNRKKKCLISCFCFAVLLLITVLITALIMWWLFKPTPSTTPPLPITDNQPNSLASTTVKKSPNSMLFNQKQKPAETHTTSSSSANNRPNNPPQSPSSKPRLTTSRPPSAIKSTTKAAVTKEPARKHRRIALAFNLLKSVNVWATPYMDDSMTSADKCETECDGDDECAVFQFFKANKTCHFFTASSFSFLTRSYLAVAKQGELYQKIDKITYDFFSSFFILK
jgi:hypothetical protein